MSYLLERITAELDLMDFITYPKGSYKQGYIAALKAVMKVLEEE